MIHKIYIIFNLPKLKMMQYNRSGLPREIKPKPVYKTLNYIILAVIILLVLWWIFRG